MGVLKYRQAALDSGMLYTISDVPTLPMAALLGFQHFLSMAPITMLIPSWIAGASYDASYFGEYPEILQDMKDNTGQAMGTILFVSGLNTIMQTSIGDRLPIVQGGSFSYLGPTFAIVFYPPIYMISSMWGDSCDPTASFTGECYATAREASAARFSVAFTTVQSSILFAGLIQMFLGYSGLFLIILKFLSPPIICCVLGAIGLGYFAAGWPGVLACPSLGTLGICIFLFFYCVLGPRIQVPAAGGKKLPIFQLLPVFLTIVVTWIIALIAEAAGAYPAGSPCLTLSGFTASRAPWFAFPYPGQWGFPYEGYKISGAGYNFMPEFMFSMIAGVLAASIESVGDYYACAELSGAPPPSAGVISRGIASEGIGLFMAGLLGTGNGTTSYSDNIAALRLTGVGSRVVVQCAACWMMFLGLFSKFGAIFAGMPGAIGSAVFTSSIGLVFSVGVSLLTDVDMKSPRNLFCVGFSFFTFLSTAEYFKMLGPGANPFCEVVDGVVQYTFGCNLLLGIFSNMIIVALIASTFIDMAMPGTDEERGMVETKRLRSLDLSEDPEFTKIYNWPLGLGRLTKNFAYLDFLDKGKWPSTYDYSDGGGDLVDLCCCCMPQLRKNIPGVLARDEVDSKETGAA